MPGLVHVIFDARATNNWPLLIPLVPLAMYFLGIDGLRKRQSEGQVSALQVKVIQMGFSFIFIGAAWMCWWMSGYAEYRYATNDVKVVEGPVEQYEVQPAGKDVSFTVNRVPFRVSCCDPRPIYRGTPRDGLGPEVLYEGIVVRLTYLDGGEIVRIETPN